MLAGMELELFTVLKDGPLSAEGIADVLGVQVLKLRPLLYTLVVAGLLAVEDNLFTNTIEAAHYLVRGEPAYLGEMQKLTASNWSRILKTADTIRAGAPLAAYEADAMNQDELMAYFRGLNSGAVADAQRLMEHHDFSSQKTLLDVGGGSGALAIAIAQAHPHLKVTITDLPSVTSITKQFVAEANLADRVEVVSADAVRDSLKGSFDVIVARHFIQILSEEEIRALMQNLSAVAKPGCVIHLIGWVLDDTRLTPKKTVNFNLVLITGYAGGQAYTEQENRTWLGEAGFQDFERIAFSDGASILTACKIT